VAWAWFLKVWCEWNAASLPVQNQWLIPPVNYLSGVKMGGDDQVPEGVQGGDAQVTKKSLLDRSLAPANEVEVSS
jgi:hypothetical protein